MFPTFPKASQKVFNYHIISSQNKRAQDGEGLNIVWWFQIPFWCKSIGSGPENRRALMDVFTQQPWNVPQKISSGSGGQQATAYGCLTFSPNQQTFGLEITGQTNEFNELSQTQRLPFAIWTQIKGYGQASKPLSKGFVHKWERMKSLQHLHWQVV